MKNNIKFAVLHIEEDTMQSIIRDVATFLVLSLCVWVSKESTVWTVVSVAMFLVFGFSWIFGSIGKETKKFKTKDELQQWVDSL
tara:strand:- start:849 stop:1100 length:252 start_codon:yes stop_codon:yes gene_type:complete